MVVLALPAGRADAARLGRDSVTCRTVLIKDQGKPYAYSVRIDKGKVTCLKARTVLRTYLAQSVSPRGWFCVRGHASQHQKWAASCANAAGANIKAFGPLKG